MPFQQHTRALTKPVSSNCLHSYHVRTVLADGNVQCEYMTAVINESLRLFPPARVTTRTCKENLTLAGNHVPAGMRGLQGMKPLTFGALYSADSCALWRLSFVCTARPGSALSTIQPVMKHASTARQRVPCCKEGGAACLCSCRSTIHAVHLHSAAGRGALPRA